MKTLEQQMHERIQSEAEYWAKRDADMGGVHGIVLHVPVVYWRAANLGCDGKVYVTLKSGERVPCIPNLFDDVLFSYSPRSGCEAVARWRETYVCRPTKHYAFDYIVGRPGKPDIHVTMHDMQEIATKLNRDPVQFICDIQDGRLFRLSHDGEPHLFWAKPIVRQHQ